MSETVLCQEYSDYCKSAGIFTGGGFSDKTSQYVSVATGTIDSLVDGVSALNEKIASAVKSAADHGGKVSASAIREVAKALGSVNEAALSTVKSGQSVASRVAHVFIGAANNNMPYSVKFTGGSEGIDPIFGHSELMLSTLEFIGGASADVTETVKARIAAFEAYLELLNKMASASRSLKEKDELLRAVREQEEFSKKALDEFKRIANSLGSSSSLSRDLEKFASSGKVVEIKKLLKQKQVNKELIKDYVSLLRLQGSVVVRADDLKRAIETVGMTLEKFHKLDSFDKIEQGIKDLEAKIYGKHGKDRIKYVNAIEKIREMATAQSHGEKFEGACPCAEPDDMFPDPAFTGGAKCSENYFGGKFLGLEKEVSYELQAENIFDIYDPLKRNFIDEQTKIISKMVDSARKASLEFAQKLSFDDGDILQFTRRLNNLRLVDSEQLIQVFATRGKDYNSEYMRQDIIAGLEDLIAAGKKIEGKVGSEMKSFISNLEEYKSFLNKYHKDTKSGEFRGAGNCSGISNASIYDRFIGGKIDLNIGDIVSAFNKSIMLGRMQNGLNLSLKDLENFSIKQDEINATVLAKEVNKMEEERLKFLKDFDTSADTFPVHKELFDLILANNIEGKKMLLHAAQAWDKKSRKYQKKIIADPLAAKSIAELISKVVIDMNWIGDPQFEDSKDFTRYFHIESVGDAKTPLTEASSREGFHSDGTTPNISLQASLIPSNNDYMKKDKYTPFPKHINDTICTHVPTLILAADPARADQIRKEGIRKVKAGKSLDGSVNLYGGKYVYPAKVADVLSGNADVANPDCTIVHSITIPSDIPQDVKFLDKAIREKHYLEALSYQRRAAEKLTMLRNLFSIMTHIDDAYSKMSGEKDDVKIGQIYGAIKEYIILTSIYPIIYKIGDKYVCGFAAMRHIGHDVIAPFEMEDDKMNGSLNNLLTDLSEYKLSLREYQYGRDSTRGDVDMGRSIPGTGAYNGDNANKNADRMWDAVYGNRNGQFKSNYARFDVLLISVIKSKYVKIMSTLAMLNLITLNGETSPDYPDGVNVGNLPYGQLRTIYGGTESRDRYLYTPKVQPECVDLYVRLYYAAVFYKILFFEENGNGTTGKKVVNQLVAMRRMALLPTNDSKFSGIMRLFFLKGFKEKIGAVNSRFHLSDIDLATFIGECNKLYDSASGTDRKRCEDILSAFVQDVNQRYGLVQTDDFNSVMDKRREKAFPEVTRLRTRVDQKDHIATNARDAFVKNHLLDGEDSPIGSLGAPSAANEFRTTPLGRATTIITPKTEYFSEDLLAAVYNFRRKLDVYVDKLTAEYEAASTNNGALVSSSLTNYIIMLKAKLQTRTSDLDRFRVIKEYLTSGGDDHKIFLINSDVLLYRDLVVNGANLIFKIYTTLTANANLYGIANEATDPINRGTFLYYLDSVNTDLVTVSRIGKTPVLDFSILRESLQAFLDRVREFHLQLRSSIDKDFSRRMDDTLVLLVNMHRSIFMEDGLLSKIQYEDSGDSQGVKVAPINDYSEFQHLAHVDNAGLGRNSFMLDQSITLYPSPLTAKDPRINLLTDIATPDLTFELLSKHFSPRNVYVLFEYLLVLMYKLFFERNGVWYGPLLSGFVQNISDLNIPAFDTLNKLEELGGREEFDPEMPFSKKVVALFRMIYKFKLKSDTLVQNDYSLLPEELKAAMKKHIPLFMMLFKFIIKQSYLQLGMLTDGQVHQNTNTPVSVNLGGNAPMDPANKDRGTFRNVKKVLGGGINISEIMMKVQMQKDQFVQRIRDIVSVPSLDSSALGLSGFQVNGKSTDSKLLGGKTSHILYANLPESKKQSDVSKKSKAVDLAKELVKEKDSKKFGEKMAALVMLLEEISHSGLFLTNFSNTDKIRELFNVYDSFMDGDGSTFYDETKFSFLPEKGKDFVIGKKNSAEIISREGLLGDSIHPDIREIKFDTSFVGSGDDLVDALCHALYDDIHEENIIRILNGFWIRDTSSKNIHNTNKTTTAPAPAPLLPGISAAAFGMPALPGGVGFTPNTYYGNIEAINNLRVKCREIFRDELTSVDSYYPGLLSDIKKYRNSGYEKFKSDFRTKYSDLRLTPANSIDALLDGTKLDNHVYSAADLAAIDVIIAGRRVQFSDEMKYKTEVHMNREFYTLLTIITNAGVTAADPFDGANALYYVDLSGDPTLCDNNGENREKPLKDASLGILRNFRSVSAIKAAVQKLITIKTTVPVNYVVLFDELLNVAKAYKSVEASIFEEIKESRITYRDELVLLIKAFKSRTYGNTREVLGEKFTIDWSIVKESYVKGFDTLFTDVRVKLLNTSVTTGGVNNPRTNVAVNDPEDISALDATKCIDRIMNSLLKTSNTGELIKDYYDDVTKFYVESSRQKYEEDKNTIIKAVQDQIDIIKGYANAAAATPTIGATFGDAIDHIKNQATVAVAVLHPNYSAAVIKCITDALKFKIVATYPLTTGIDDAGLASLKTELSLTKIAEDLNFIAYTTDVTVDGHDANTINNLVRNANIPSYVVAIERARCLLDAVRAAIITRDVGTYTIPAEIAEKKKKLTYMNRLFGVTVRNGTNVGTFSIKDAELPYVKNAIDDVNDISKFKALVNGVVAAPGVHDYRVFSEYLPRIYNKEEIVDLGSLVSNIARYNTGGSFQRLPENTFIYKGKQIKATRSANVDLKKALCTSDVNFTSVDQLFNGANKEALNSALVSKNLAALFYDNTGISVYGAIDGLKADQGYLSRIGRLIAQYPPNFLLSQKMYAVVLSYMYNLQFTGAIRTLQNIRDFLDAILVNTRELSTIVAGITAVDADHGTYLRKLLDGDTALKISPAFVGGAGKKDFDAFFARYPALYDLYPEVVNSRFAFAFATYKYLRSEYPFLDEQQLFTLSLYNILSTDDSDPANDNVLKKLRKELEKCYDYILKTGKGKEDILKYFVGNLSDSFVGSKVGKVRGLYHKARSSGTTNNVASNGDIIIDQYNVSCILRNDGTESSNLHSADFCHDCGSVCEMEKMKIRAKNAIKYGTLIYKDLAKVYSEIGSKERYLAFTPYISDVYEIISKEKNVYPLSVAVDMIPTFVNTITQIPGTTNYGCTNILKSLETPLARETLGIHCNNIYDIENLLSGGKAGIMNGLELFLFDDKLHAITLDDFPSLKSQVSDMKTASISTSNVEDYASQFGKLTKYLYEQKFKSMFANSFPVFNNLDNPKYMISSHDNGQIHQIKTFSKDVMLNNSGSLITSLPVLLGYDSDMLSDLQISTYAAIREQTMVDTSVVGDRCTIQPEDLVPMLELNTNTEQMLSYMTMCGSLKKYDSLGNTLTNIESICITNFMDIGLTPININSMMREIPLANTINNIYSFDVIMKWLHKDRNVLSTDSMQHQGQHGSRVFNSDRRLAAVPAVSGTFDYELSYTLNPLKRSFVPYHGSAVDTIDEVLHMDKQPAMRVGLYKSGVAVVGTDILHTENAKSYSFQNTDAPSGLGTDNRVMFSAKVEYEDATFKADFSVSPTADTCIALQYNNYPVFKYDAVNNARVAASYERFKSVNTGLGYQLSKDCKLKLVKRLANNADRFDVPAGYSGLRSDAVDFVDKDSYYDVQSAQVFTARDLHHGVDPDLQSPVIGINIYAETLWQIYNDKFKQEYQSDNRRRPGDDTFSTGVSSLYITGPRT
jgi:hypothetical protein